MTTDTIRIDQCLFGYEDGHRLLAASMRLGDEATILTHQSDLAPGTVFGSSEGYWAGLPLPKAARYALLRTWPAPEMPRPGCVWTHVLLLPPGIFQVARDLTILQEVVRRPHGTHDRTAYAKPMEVRLSDITRSFRRDADFAEGVLRLLASLYGNGETLVPTAAPGAMDQPLFAVWSQQWPRLRRNFRFQTATSRDPQPNSAARFDFVLHLDDAERSSPAVRTPAWLRAACSDVLHQRGSDLRDFLWLYGNDVRKQRSSFRPLCEIKLLHDNPTDDAGSALLHRLTKSFPDPSDALRLKQDIVDGLVVPTAQLDVLWFIIGKGAGAAMPHPSQAGVARLAQLWPDRAANLLHFVERAAEEDVPLSSAILETVTDAIPAGEFWELTAMYPRVREQMVSARPDLIRSAQALALDNDTLVSLIAVLPQDAEVVDELIPKLLRRDETRLAEMAFERFPKSSAVQVIMAADGETVPVANAWWRGLVERPAVLLTSGVMKNITRTSMLYEIAETLGWLCNEVVRGGTEPWLAALIKVHNDLADDRMDILRAFMIALALSAPGDGARSILEKLFDVVHTEALRSRLPWKARDILDPLLPDLGWRRGWDLSLRLRLAVAQNYVQCGYEPSSYSKLASDRKSREMLAEAAREIRGGKRLAMALKL